MSNPAPYNNKITLIIKATLNLMPVWFGLFFLGPVIAEIALLAAHNGVLPDSLNSLISNTYLRATCMAFGGIYGLIAFKTGRWI